MSTVNRGKLARFNGVKRVVDVALVATASPIVLAAGGVCYGLVRATSGAPVMYKQERAGMQGRPFIMWKFRSMSDARDAEGRLLPDKFRLTRAGALLRKTSLDELPQLWNVIKGDMALVGPRPLYTSYLPYYTDREATRHDVRPGITGLAQASGRNSLLWDARLELDAEYAERASLWLDAKVLFKTAAKVFGGKDVAAVAADSGEPLNVVRSYPHLKGYALRRFEYVDIPLRVDLFNDPRVRRHMRLPEGVTAESTRQWLSESRLQPGRKDFVLYEQSSGRVVGLLGVNGRELPDVPELYILVDPEMQGKGLGSLALELLLKWAKAQPGCNGLSLVVGAENHAALALYRRAGFVEAKESQGRISMEVLWQP